MRREDEERIYAQEMGREALERQKTTKLCPTCFAPTDNHHPRCPEARRQTAQQQRRKR